MHPSFISCNLILSVLLIRSLHWKPHPLPNHFSYRFIRFLFITLFLVIVPFQQKSDAWHHQYFKQIQQQFCIASFLTSQILIPLYFLLHGAQYDYQLIDPPSNISQILILFGLCSPLNTINDFRPEFFHLPNSSSLPSCHWLYLTLLIYRTPITYHHLFSYSLTISIHHSLHLKFSCFIVTIDT